MWYSKVKNKVRCNPKIPRLYERRPHRNRFRSQTWNAASVRTEDASSAFCMCTDEGTVWTCAVLFTTEKIKNGIGAALSESSLFLNIKRTNRGCSTMMHPTQLLVKNQDMLGWLHLLAGLGKLQYCVETESMHLYACQPNTEKLQKVNWWAFVTKTDWKCPEFMLHALQRFIIILNIPLSLVVQHSWFSLRLYAEKSMCIYMDICMENQLQPSPTPTSSCFKQQWQTIKP